MEEVFNMGRELQAAGQFDKAEECYRRYLEDHEDAFKAHNNLGVVLEEQGKLGEAVKCYKTASELVPDDTIPLYNLGHAFFRQERFESALGVFEQVIDREPDHGLAHLNLAAIHWRNGDANAAEPLLRVASGIPEVSERALHKLGLLLFDDGRFEEALTCQKQALALIERPQHYFHVAMCHRVLSQHREAADALANAVRLDPPARIAHEHRVRALLLLDEHDEARAALNEWATALPGDAICEHMRAAMDDGDLARCSVDYIRDTFGAFAADYEQTLERLEYRAPKAIEETLRERLPVSGRFARVLDAGCGTGLCGPVLRPLADHLTGVDLAAPMLEQARERELYDVLSEADLIEFLAADAQREAPFDAIVAGDTFNYFGELDALLQAAGAAATDGALLMFTLETGEDETRDFRLMPHGRYAHSKAYVTRALTAAGFDDTRFDPFVLRKENGRDVAAWVISGLRKAG